MGLFILTETSAGYALFKAKDKKLLKSDTLAEDVGSVDAAVSALKLKKFLVRSTTMSDTPRLLISGARNSRTP
jgi:hypothetical protein